MYTYVYMYYIQFMLKAIIYTHNINDINNILTIVMK